MPSQQIFPVKKLVNLTAPLAARVSAFRFDHRLQSENEAIRRLIEAGLSALDAGVPPPSARKEATHV